MLNPGDILERRYQIVRLLGAGGMSNIYLCRIVGAQGPEKFWVIKEMSVHYQEPSEQATAVELFLREGELLQRLDHRNLPKVIDRFVANGKYHFVMEYVDGEDLGKLIARNPAGLPEAMVLPWAIEVATVLYYLHCQHPPIVFRDMKPSNIMISKGTVKLIDFGIARSFKPNKKKDTISIGSPGYAPPEQYSGQTDPRSDIYALGATLHHLLTGKDPTETRTPFKFESVHGLKPGVSEATSGIIARATDLDPQNRFQTALEMKKALQQVAGVSSRPLPQAPQTQLSMDRPLNLAQAALDAQEGAGAAAAHHGPTGTTAIGPLPATPPPAPAPPPPPPPAPAPAPAAQAPVQPAAPPAPPPPKPRQPMPLTTRVLLCAVLAVALRLGRAPLKQEMAVWLHPGPHPTPSPTVAPGPLAPAEQALDAGRPREAVAFLARYLVDHPEDVSARILLANADVRLSGAAAIKVGVQATPGTDVGDEILRGTLLAQDQLNLSGGANRVDLQVVPSDSGRGDVTIGPSPSATPSVALVSGGDVSVAPAPSAQWDTLVDFLRQSHARPAVLVVGTKAPGKAEGFKVDVVQALPASLGTYGAVVLAGTDPKPVLARAGHPPVWTLDPWQPGAPEGLMTVSDWWPDPSAPEDYAFALRYQGKFNRVPGAAAWRAWRAVMVVGEALDAASGPTGAELAPALKKVSIPTPKTWYVLKAGKDGWHLAQRLEATP